MTPFPSCPVCEGACRRRFEYAETAVFRCNECRLLIRWPLPSNESLDAVYQLEYYNPEAEPSRPPSPPEIVRQIADSLEHIVGSWKAQQVLDFGCGVGVFSKELMSRGASVIGIERAAVKDLLDHGFPVAASVEASKNCGPPPSVAVMCLVIEHLEDPVATLKELHDALRPGGYIYVETANSDSALARLTGRRWREIVKEEHLVWFNPRNLREACHKAGFVHVEELNFELLFPAHGPIRRLVRNLSGKLGLQGGLRMLAQKRA